MNNHSLYMSRCLVLAAKGLGKVKSNPLVGCVIVENDEIIGEGYHAHFGGPHAEVMAIQSVTEPGRLANATLYVNLEPCHHFGKTPPCSLLIEEKKIPHVVVGQNDPFEKVNGKGIQHLRSKGVKVEIGILEEECRTLNKRFNTFHEQKRPYVILKWAQSADGFIDAIRTDHERRSVAISGMSSRTLSHQWRTEEMGIVVGRGTVEKDNPQLNVRWVEGDAPIRIVIDPHLKSLHFSDSHIFDGSQPTLFFHTNQSPHLSIPQLEWIQLEAPLNWESIFQVLYRHNITSILVEGGAMTLQSLIQAQWWDEARVFVAPIYLHEGIAAPLLNASPHHSESIAQDTLFYYYQK